MITLSIDITDDQFQGLVLAQSAYDRGQPDDSKVGSPQAYAQMVMASACDHYFQTLSPTTLDGVLNQKAAVEADLQQTNAQVDQLAREKAELIAKLQEYEAPTNTNGVPSWVYASQAFKALILAGKMAIVQTALASLPGTAGDVARAEFDKSARFYRNNATIEGFVRAGLFTDDQLDQLFIQAATL